MRFGYRNDVQFFVFEVSIRIATLEKDVAACVDMACMNKTVFLREENGSVNSACDDAC